MQPFAHRLAAALECAGRGEFPKADGTIEVRPPPPGRAMAVVAFTAHYMIASSVADWTRAQLPPDDLLAPMSPRFLTALGAKLDRQDEGINLLLAARGLQGRTTLRETTGERHSRVTHPTATATRCGCSQTRLEPRRSFSAADWRTAPKLRSTSTRSAETRASPDKHSPRHAGSSDQVNCSSPKRPGNAASIGTLLTAGFQPIGSEVLFSAHTREPPN
jgi:hypothetical protein